VGSARDAAQVLGCRVEALLARASPEAARIVGDAALALLPEAADREESAHLLRVRGTIHRLLGRLAESRTALEESLRLFEELGKPNDARLVRQQLALVALEAHDVAEVREYLKGVHEAPEPRYVPTGL